MLGRRLRCAAHQQVRYAKSSRCVLNPVSVPGYLSQCFSARFPVALHSADLNFPRTTPYRRKFAVSLLFCQRLTADNDREGGTGPTGAAGSAPGGEAAAAAGGAGAAPGSVPAGPPGTPPLTPDQYVESGRARLPQDGITSALAPDGAPVGGRWHVAVCSSDQESLSYHEGTRAGPRMSPRRRAALVLHGVPSERLVERGLLASLLIGQRSINVAQAGMLAPHSLYESILPMLAGERLLSAQERIPSDARGPFIKADVSTTSEYRCTIAATLYAAFRYGLGAEMRGKLRLAFRSAYLRHCVRQLRYIAQLPPIDLKTQDEDAAAAAAAASRALALAAESKLAEEEDAAAAASGAGASESKSGSPGDEPEEELEPLEAVAAADESIDVATPNSHGKAKGLLAWSPEDATQHSEEAGLLVEVSESCAKNLSAADGMGDAEAWLRERRLPGLHEFEIKLLGTAVESTARMCLRLLRAKVISSEAANFVENLLMSVRRLMGVLDIEDAMHLTDAEARALGPEVEAWHKDKAARQGPPIIEEDGPTLAPVRGFRGLEHLVDERDTSGFEGQNLTSMQEHFVDLALGPRPGRRADGRVDFRGDMHDIVRVLQAAGLAADKLMSRSGTAFPKLVCSELCALIEDVFLQRLPVPWTWSEARNANDDALKNEGQEDTLDGWLAVHGRELRSTDLELRRDAMATFRQLEELALQAHEDAARDGLCDPWQPPCQDQQLLRDAMQQIRFLLKAYVAARGNHEHLVAESGTALVASAQMLACWNAVSHLQGMHGQYDDLTILLNRGHEDRTARSVGGRMKPAGPMYYLRFSSLTPGFHSLAAMTTGACLCNPAAIAARPLVDECFKAYQAGGARPIFEFFTSMKYDPIHQYWILDADKIEWKILDWMVKPDELGGSSFDFPEEHLPTTIRRQFLQAGGSRGL